MAGEATGTAAGVPATAVAARVAGVARPRIRHKRGKKDTAKIQRVQSRTKQFESFESSYWGVSMKYSMHRFMHRFDVVRGRARILYNNALFEIQHQREEALHEHGGYVQCARA